MTQRVDVRFYADLRDFLTSDQRSGVVTRSFDVAGSVKDLVEGCGVPHTEIDVILVNGRAVDFSYRVANRDHISVFPPFRTFELPARVRLGPDPLPEPRFVVDAHLGKLTRYLRLLGFDTVSEIDWSDSQLVTVSVEERRILLTRDIGLLMHRALSRGYYVRASSPRLQLTEVAQRFELASTADPFLRCMMCNATLLRVDKGSLSGRLPHRTQRHFDDFRSCPGCDRVYWRGSHHRHLREIVESVTGAA